MKIIEIEKTSTIAQQKPSSFASFKISPSGVTTIKSISPSPTPSEMLKKVFLNGLDLKQLPFVRAVNI